MATIETYQLASGAKRYRVRYRTPENKQTDKRGFTTVREAKAFAASIEVSKASGEFVAYSSGLITVGALARPWLDNNARIKQTTAAKRESAWTHRVGPRWAAVPIGDIRPSHVRRWVADLVAADVGVASIESALDVLRGVLAAALEDRHLASNPAAGVHPPRRKHQRRGYLSHQQVQALAVEVGAHRPELATVVGFLAYTGLRWGEMAALRVESFDMLRHRATVSEAVAEVRGRVVFDTPKGHERRSVPFPRFLAAALAELMAGKARSDLVFTGPTGAVLAVSRFRPRVFAPAVGRCQVADSTFPAITPHDLRHTAASLAISAGANVKAVQTMLGHASATLTLDTYADLFADDLDAVAAHMDVAAQRAGVGIVGTVWARA